MGRALVWSNLLSEPLFTLYGFLAFILYKDLGASAFQIALLTMLKPVVTVLSFYWSAGLKGRSGKLKSNVMWAGFWMRAPFLLCPWVDSIWFVIGAAVNYMFFYRAAIPAWLEMIRRNLGEGKRGRAFSISSALGYVEGVALSLAMGGLLDENPGLWKGLFFGAAAIGLLTLAVQSNVPVEGAEEKGERLSWRELIVRPWRDSFQLMRDRPDFSRFQWGFMVCGFGIMLIQPALPLFCVDTLGISYLEMAAAVSIAKGLGFAVSSPVWSKWIDKVTVHRLSAAVFIAVGLFPIFLSFSVWNVGWLYAAYFWYGVGQGGSHLVWNLSGPIFAGKEESSRYTGVNVVLAGLRGGVAPPLGGLLAVLWGPVGVLALGGALSFYSGASLLRYRFQRKDLSLKE
jgi:MFS family permease